MTLQDPSPAPAGRPRAGRQWPWLAVILTGLLAALFFKSFQPGQILFVNDVTFGQMKALPNHLPGAFTGVWYPDAWAGMEGPAAAPTLSALLAWVFPPEIFLKLYAPFTLFFVGFCAWVFFCQLKFSPWVCLLGGIAAALNMHFFSIACWGLGVWNIAAGMTFLALAALCAKSIPQLWAKGILAGLAVGMSLMEGFDVGVILSLSVGAFIVWRTFTEEKAMGRKAAVTLGMEAMVIFFAVFIAAHTISTMVGTQVQGMVWSSSNQNAASKDERWAPATQWSLPKLESLRVIIPGLFGYRLIDRITVPDKSSAYWGTVGRDPRIVDLKSDDPKLRAKAIGNLILSPQLRQGLESSDPQTRNNAINALTRGSTSAMRFSGNGEYAGVLVSVLALFALANSCRADGRPYSRGERRAVWFWAAAALVSLLASWGRHGFLYRWLYELPYASTIRNPIKFLHPFHIAWLILAAYGMEALWRRAKVSRFEKGWMAASAALVGVALVALFIFNGRKPDLINYLAQEGFDPGTASQIADFSVAEARWFVGWLFVSCGIIAILFMGEIIVILLGGARARLGWIFLGVIIVIDLARSDLPWIHYYNYKTAYAGNSVLEFLQDHPYEHRVMGRLSPRGLGAGLASPFGRLYSYWQENDFPFRGIQMLDFAQWPRTPQMDIAYMNNFALAGHDLSHCDLWPAERLWELTDTRYLLTSSMFVPMLNAAAESPDAFRIKTPLKVVPKPQVTTVEDAGDLTVAPDDNGPYALIEFTNALPRAKLYSRWESPPNDEAVLQTLLSHDFDPRHTVLIATNTPVSQPSGDPKIDPGSVSITEYRTKYIQLQAHAATPAVLLLNDRIAPGWKAWVDQHPAPVLRCNYLMRGVFLTPGDHTVEFRFQSQVVTLYLTICAWGVGILTAGYLKFRQAG